MIDDAHDHDYPLPVSSGLRRIVAVAVVALVGALVFALTGCSDATGPTPDTFHPDFAKTCNGGACAVGGGGASGAVCQYPNHMSGPDCVTKGIEAAGGFLGAVGVCYKNPFSWQCAGIATANGGQWYNFWNTPDATGAKRDPRPDDFPLPGDLYPIGGPHW